MKPRFRHPAPARQRGAALIIALVIVAIAIILTTSLVWKTHLDLRRVENQLYGGQAISYAIGAEDWAREVLARDDLNVDHLQEDWASQDARFPIEGGTLIGSLTDLQGRFNLNNLYNPEGEGEPREEQLQALRDLFALQGVTETIADAVLDWQDRNIEPHGFAGAEDSQYSRMTPPYLTPNSWLMSPSELRAIGDITAEEYSAVRDYVAALPGEGNLTRINVNTASGPVLQAVGDELDETDIAAIMNFRERDKGITQLTELDSLLDNTSDNTSKLPDDRFSVTTNWFLLTVRAEIGSSSITMYSVLRRDPDTGVVETVARTLGTW